MKIGIDARFYGVLGKGLGRYTQKLITYLEKVDHENEYVIFLRKENWADYQPHNKKFKKVLADYQWYTIFEQIFFPLKIWMHGIDVMHYTHFNVPLLYFGKFVVTIHDLILTKYPTERATTLGPLLYFLKHKGYQLVIRSAVKRAKGIVAVSEYTKKEIIDHFNITGDKITVTYESVDALPETTESTDEVFRRYHIQKPYLLYVGNVYPHKNVEGLLRAFKDVITSKPDLKLVLVGKEDYFFKKIKRFVRQLGLESSVIFTGFVTDSDLPHLYKNGSLYVFPSFCEGFGLPALEACSYGLPVIASNSSCLPEILGNAAIYFDPEDGNDIVEKIHTVLDNTMEAEKLRSEGYARVKKYSWDKMAELTLRLYKRANSR